MIIRPALPDDADRIYKLKREIFGEKYLSYTVYQVPLAAAHIALTVTRGFDSTRECYAVASRDKDIVGYYNGVAEDTTWFLNYIGVSADFAHRGIGSQLLDHFEAYGRNIRCEKYGLDVFAENERAVAWYSNRHYTKTSTSFIVRVRFRTANAPRQSRFAGLPFFLAALAREREVGFSKCTIPVSAGQIELGLIGGHTCKLLGLSRVSVNEALDFLDQNLPAQRHTLILSCLAELPRGVDLETYEEVLRMEKAAPENSH